MSDPTQRILAVDDNPDNLFLVQLALEQEGHDIQLVDNGPEALEQIAKAPPDLILLDVMMPGMNGYEVARRIRSNPNLPFIPILMITAHEQSSAVEGLDAGADEFIRKPVQIDELQARVRSLLRLKQSIDQRESFVQCLTHDLRTPLVAADRMLNLISQGVFGEVSEDLQEALSSLATSNHNMLSMLNTLLDAYTYDVGQKVLSFIPFPVAEMVAEVVRELEPIARDKDVELRSSVADNVGKIRGDRLELRRVVANLVGNALKFTDTGSIEVRVARDNGQLILEVEDTGTGIAPEDRPRIFDRFRQGKHLRSGSGLGLYLCQQIVTAHQGSMDFRSEVGTGTVFTVRLPIDRV
ncbi:MAG TPA: hybrid sensor histidine kinase/response regulator [Oscillatoriales cyanobacterium M59_W2019_021]|nr:MAG: hybrid sensor histidine kinase/response regulator [Cyanobacteria bacterium J055]HIK32642.1 hybrid sensor histidine kinase/response regulator [Oscillatoriales cyanobacterium M4454_W2019_049]HIK51676.1 hybrid sensor histidine kinase/response regulator [Oscillatoriales cyanobacterium M59_W2019_021]